MESPSPSISPEVSVVIPVWNRAWCIERALRSVFAAGCSSIEAIVVDDGSDDGSLDAVHAVAESHPEWTIRWATHPRNTHCGVGASRNRGAAMARGEYLAFLDSDDEFLPGRFDHALEILNSLPGTDGVYEAQEVVEQDGRTTVRPLAEPDEFSEPDAARMFPPRMPTTGSLIVRKALFDRVGGFEEGKWVGEDIHLWMRMAMAGHLLPGRRDVPVVRHHRHESNVGGFDPWQVILRELASVRRWARRQPMPAGHRRNLQALSQRRIFGYLGAFARPRRPVRDRLRLTLYSLRCEPGLAWSPRFWYAAARMFWPGPQKEQEPS